MGAAQPEGALLNAELRYLVDTFEKAEQLGNSTAATLLAFSPGRISVDQVIEPLQLEHEQDLFLPMAQAHLPMPRLSGQVTEAMVIELEQLAGSSRPDA